MPRRLPNPPYKISTTDSYNGTPCWDWLGATRGGYGTYTVNIGLLKTSVQATRVFYEKLKGKIPFDKHLDHLCKRRICVNPDHLEPVNNDVNVQRGKLAILNASQVKEIREFYAAGTYNQNELARKFNVSQSTIHVIVTNKQWKNV